MGVFGGNVYVFIYILISLCIDISNSLAEGTNLTVCAGNEASFNSELSNTSTVFIIVFKKGPNTIGTYQPEKGSFIDAKYKDRYSIVKERYGITLNISDTQVLDQGRFVCEITYRTGPDVIKELHLIVKERENSNLIMFEKIVQGSNTFITCHANQGRVKLKMPDNSTKTCSCCFIEQCSKDVCKTLTLNESDVDHSKECNEYNGIWVTATVLGSVIMLIMIVIILLGMKHFRNKRIKKALRKKQKSQLYTIDEYRTATAINAERIKEDVTYFCRKKNRKSQFKPIHGYRTDTAINAETLSSSYMLNEEDINEKSVHVYGYPADTASDAKSLTYGDSSKVDVQVESDNYSPFEGETIPLNRSMPTGESLPLKEIMEIHSRSGSRDDTGTYVSQISKDSIKSN